MTLFYRQKWIKREDLQAHPEAVFLFGDNTKRKGMGGQAKEMRGEPNAIGIATKWLPTRTDPDAYFSDDDYVECCRIVSNDFRPAFVARGVAPLIIIPADGLGTGLSKLPEKAPRVNAHVEWMIQMLVGGGEPAWKQLLNGGSRSWK